MLVSELQHQYLTGVINELTSPNQFLHRLLFPSSAQQTVPTETIRLGVLTGGREIAPFVKRNGEAIIVGGTSSEEQTVQGPNIRIKRPFTPSELLYGRRPGSRIFLQGSENNLSEVRQHIARDLQYMADMLTNTQEWLVSQMLQGVISYEQADQEVFTITFPRDSSANITPTVFLDDGTPSNVKFHALITSVKQAASDNDVPSPTDAVLGTKAANDLRALLEAGAIKGFENTGYNPNLRGTGFADFAAQYNDDGAILIGQFDGIRFWEYRRTAQLDGVTVNMIRPKYGEFFSRSPASDRVEYFAAIPDMKVLQGRVLQAKRFSKSWEQEDPSVLWHLSHTRPLPVPRRPNAHISVQLSENDT